MIARILEKKVRLDAALLAGLLLAALLVSGLNAAVRQSVEVANSAAAQAIYQTALEQETREEFFDFLRALDSDGEKTGFIARAYMAASVKARKGLDGMEPGAVMSQEAMLEFLKDLRRRLDNQKLIRAHGVGPERSI